MALVLYHIAPSRSSTVLWMLEEIGRPYELRVMSGKTGETRAPAYLAVNPLGKVPALDHDGTVITEAAAICLYLADAFPEAGLTVPIGERRRGTLLKWMFFAPGTLEPAILDRAFKRTDEAPRGALPYGDYDTTIDALARALAAGPYLLGDGCTVADVVIGATLRWGMTFKLVPERPEFRAYVDRLAARPAFQRAKAKDEALAG